MATEPNSNEEAMLFGSRFRTEDAPDGPFPANGMAALDAQRLVEEELQLEGDPNRNLATFVTTSMEPEAKQLIYDNNYRNFIDHAEYPISAEIEQRCIRMLADLYNAPGETTGARCQGSSEAIMLGALSLKWKWKERRASRSTGRTWSSAATCTSSGKSSANTSMSNSGWCRCRRASTRSAPRTSSPTSTRTRSASPPSSARPSPVTRTTSAVSTTCWWG